MIIITIIPDMVYFADVNKMIKIVKGAESQDLAPFLCVIASPRLETWQE